MFQSAVMRARFRSPVYEVDMTGSEFQSAVMRARFRSELWVLSPSLAWFQSAVMRARFRSELVDAALDLPLVSIRCHAGTLSKRRIAADSAH